MQCACAILLSVAWPAPQYFSTLSYKRQDFRGKKYHKMSVLTFSTNFVWNISHCKKTRARYIINVHLPSCTVPVYAEQRSRYSDWLRAGRSEDRIPVGARFSAPVQTGPGAYTASYTMGTGSFPGVKSGRDVTLNSHPLPVPWSWKSRAIPLLPLCAYDLYRSSVPVQGCTLPLPYSTRYSCQI